MAEHGDYDSELKKWFCNYWMSEDEWLDIHSYSPLNASEEKEGDDRKDEPKIAILVLFIDVNQKVLFLTIITLTDHLNDFENLFQYELGKL